MLIFSCGCCWGLTWIKSLHYRWFSLCTSDIPNVLSLVYFFLPGKMFKKCNELPQIHWPLWEFSWDTGLLFYAGVVFGFPDTDIIVWRNGCSVDSVTAMPMATNTLSSKKRNVARSLSCRVWRGRTQNIENISTCCTWIWSKFRSQGPLGGL